MDSRPSQSGRPSPTHQTQSTLTKSISDASSQSLSSVLNNPHVPRPSDPSSWLTWWPSSSPSIPVPEFTPISSNPKPGSELSRPDFLPYLTSISDSYTRFDDIQKHNKHQSSLDPASPDTSDGHFAGEALVACLREVPALYFKEDFELEDGATFRAACPFRTPAENVAVQEKLSQYLDVVEMHLVKEISLRSSSFFEAQGQLEDLNSRIVKGCARIRELKETIRILDTDLVGSARRVQELSLKRNDLIALQNKLRLILYVNQALATLRLLVSSGDCAGALDVTDDLQHLLDEDELIGLHCFRHLRDHVAGSIDSINSILSAEFMRASIRDVGNVDASIISRAKARASMPTYGADEEVSLDEEDMSNIRDRLLPLIIGLLRTAKLPAVLRIYRDELTADMRGAIKTVVSELLPVLVVQPLESDFAPGERVGDSDGGGSSLKSQLKSLSPESFVQLLGAIFMTVRAHLTRAFEVKKAIERIMGNLDGHYAADSVAAALAIGAAAAETAQETNDSISSFVPHISQRSTTKISSFQGRGNDGTTPSNMSRNFRADVLRENTEALFAACDFAHGRWAKLLGVRAPVHPKLRLQEFLSLYRITQEFIGSTEKIGGRLGYSIRGTLQSQARAFVDFQHESRMTKMRAVLDQENWAEVDVPDEYQAIVNSVFCPESSLTTDTDGASSTTTAVNNENSPSNDGSPKIDAELHSSNHGGQNDSTLTYANGTAEPSSSSSSGLVENNNADPGTSSAQANEASLKERAKSSHRMLSLNGIGYHMVNCGLILVKMLSEYIDMNNCLPALSSELVHRVVEILKLFNTRTCQLVLGAGAMQVSGLRSITSKHLALASQVVGFTYNIIPEIRRILFQKVPETHRGLLSLEIDRVAQDYRVHQDEIHSKLVQIMRERLLVHLRGLPQIVESWNRPEDADSQPSQFARSLIKEVGFLQRVLSRTLLEVEVQAIFRQVVIILHTQISEAFSNLEISTPEAKTRLYRDIQHILGCIRSLPSDNLAHSGPPNWGQLDELLVQRFPETGK